MRGDNLRSMHYKLILILAFIGYINTSAAQNSSSLNKVEIYPDAANDIRVYLLTADHLYILDRWDDKSDTLFSTKAFRANKYFQKTKLGLLKRSYL